MERYSSEKHVKWKVRRAVLERDKACVYCGRPVARIHDDSDGGFNDQWRAYDEQGKSFHFDHQIPFIRGGASDESNIVLACAECNLKKGGRLEGEESPAKEPKPKVSKYLKPISEMGAIDPLCGWEWLNEHLGRISVERILDQHIQIVCSGQLVGMFVEGDAGHPVRKAMKALRKAEVEQ